MFVFLMLSFHLRLPYPVCTNLITCISNRYEAAPYGGGYGPVNELLLFLFTLPKFANIFIAS